MRTTLLLVALNFAPVHLNLLRAIEKGARLILGSNIKVIYVLSESYKSSYRASPDASVIWTPPSVSGIGTIISALKLCLYSPIGAIRAATRGSRTIVFTETTHPYNALLLQALRRSNRDLLSLYYLHEPSGAITKIRKGDGLLRSLMTYLVQVNDTAASDYIFVSRTGQLEGVTRSFPFVRPEKMRVAPLMFDDLAERSDSTMKLTQARDTVLYLGRADEARCLSLFIAAAALAYERRLPIRFVLLTNSKVRMGREVTPNLSARVGKPYTDEEMAQELSRSTAVFNVHSVAHAGSAVTPVALMFGVPLLISTNDAYLRELLEAGSSVVEEPYTPAGVLDAMATIAADFDVRSERAREAFERLFSYRMFGHFYGPVLLTRSASSVKSDVENV